jgi:peptide/nickel transport system ATP-binding protein
MLARLVKPTSGGIYLKGADSARIRIRNYRSVTQLVFQDPFASFNPVHDIRYHLERPLQNYLKVRKGKDLDKAVGDLLTRVKLGPQFADKFPYELSGGQLQRVAIARALAAQPEVLLADEPVSMLDVSIRLGILNLLGELRDDGGLAILYVTHDIASARYFADEIAVMYSGQVIEKGTSLDVADKPAHPYTQLLLASAPDPERVEAPEITKAVSGAPSTAAATGCRFRSRCPFAMAVCETEPPQFGVDDGHTAACWLHSDSLTDDDKIPLRVNA